jgi:hypothetical protein
MHSPFLSPPPIFSHILQLKVRPFLKIGKGLRIIVIRRIAMGDRAPQTPKLVVVNDWIMSVYVLHLRRKMQIHFAAKSVRSTRPSLARTCNVIP